MWGVTIAFKIINRLDQLTMLATRVGMYCHIHGCWYVCRRTHFERRYWSDHDRHQELSCKDVRLGLSARRAFAVKSGCQWIKTELYVFITSRYIYIIRRL